MNKPNQKPRNQQISSRSPSRIKQVWMRKDRIKCQIIFTALKARSFSEWYFDSGCFRHMTKRQVIFHFSQGL